MIWDSPSSSSASRAQVLEMLNSRRAIVCTTDQYDTETIECVKNGLVAKQGEWIEVFIVVGSWGFGIHLGTMKEGCFPVDWVRKILTTMSGEYKIRELGKIVGRRWTKPMLKPALVKLYSRKIDAASKSMDTMRRSPTSERAPLSDDELLKVFGVSEDQAPPMSKTQKKKHIAASSSPIPAPLPPAALKHSSYSTAIAPCRKGEDAPSDGTTAALTIASSCDTSASTAVPESAADAAEAPTLLSNLQMTPQEGSPVASPASVTAGQLIAESESDRDAYAISSLLAGIKSDMNDVQTRDTPQLIPQEMLARSISITLTDHARARTAPAPAKEGRGFDDEMEPDFEIMLPGVVLPIHHDPVGSKTLSCQSKRWADFSSDSEDDVDFQEILHRYCNGVISTKK
eukprot:GEMP01019469.1.p1 GENE.GEMP01019469.1~~GEMP01019469.1.p1  ORF type:complete len:400 (+),score=105.81 GEMP01019469.1:335-1534(+)